MPRPEFSDSIAGVAQSLGVWASPLLLGFARPTLLEGDSTGTPFAAPFSNLRRGLPGDGPHSRGSKRLDLLVGPRGSIPGIFSANTNLLAECFGLLGGLRGGFASALRREDDAGFFGALRRGFEFAGRPALKRASTQAVPNLEKELSHVQD